MAMNKLLEIKGSVQHYAWGGCRDEISGKNPYIADLLGIAASPGLPFAELWLGAHPRAPSLVKLDHGMTTPMHELIADNPRRWLGSGLTERGIEKLPFLLKILDSARPLSIQAHPDQELAQVLHERDPGNYPDANHKPEIAIALGEGLEVFCRFRPVSEIKEDIERLPPLSRFFAGLRGAATEREWLSRIYNQAMTAADLEVAKVLAELQALLDEQGAVGLTDQWLLRLLPEYPGDRGCLSAYFLNIERLESGQAVFLEPNEPHAYLRGVIIECMATSDNVVRAGLTDKFIDRETLLGMLTYQAGRPTIMEGSDAAPGEKIYRGGASEFQVEILKHAAGQEVEADSDNMVSLMLVLDGEVGLAGPDWQVRGERGSAWLWPGSLDKVEMTFIKEGSTLVRARPNLQPLR